ncbi:DUF6900 domain-containing protein [Rhodospirillum sp. A1_3_36]|uniref:DUF6900 domain-containing protein n=1 Tax=Rhodospirillum sp. A1_3_36 TaxID=3391666 RepID=UPI0039A4F9E2
MTEARKRIEAIIQTKIENGSDRDAVLLTIAQEYFHVETLEERHSDSLDFHDTSVWSMKWALEAAYRAGKESGA